MADLHEVAGLRLAGWLKWVESRNVKQEEDDASAGKLQVQRCLLIHMLMSPIVAIVNRVLHYHWGRHWWSTVQLGLV